MTIEVRWYIPGKVIYAVATTSDLSIDAVREFNEAMLDYLNNGSAPIYLISNLSAIGATAFLSSYDVWKELTYMRHPSLEMGIVIGANGFVMFLATVVTQLVRGKARFCSNLDEALISLKEIVPSLPWETAVPQNLLS